MATETKRKRRYLTAANVEDFLRENPPLSFGAVGEMKNRTEGAVRKAIREGRLPEPLVLQNAEGKKTRPFFLPHMVADWNPEG